MNCRLNFVERDTVVSLISIDILIYITYIVLLSISATPRLQQSFYIFTRSRQNIRTLNSKCRVSGPNETALSMAPLCQRPSVFTGQRCHWLRVVNDAQLLITPAAIKDDDVILS